ncbi:MAG: hypothetical protein R2856_14805 [Caldilineaceae bacterium]
MDLTGVVLTDAFSRRRYPSQRHSTAATSWRPPRPGPTAPTTPSPRPTSAPESDLVNVAVVDTDQTGPQQDDVAAPLTPSHLTIEKSLTNGDDAVVDTAVEGD